MGGKAGRLAKSAGLRADMPALDGYRRLMRESAALHDAQRARIAAEDDPEAVHQARVALRRMRSLTRGFDDMLAPAAARDIRGLLKARFAALGPLRDADVAAETLATPETRAHAAALRRDLRDRIAADDALSLRIAVEGVLHDRARVLRGDARRRLADAPLPLMAGRALHDAWTTLLSFGPEPDRLDPESLHEFRKRAKDMRYLVEFFGPLFDAPAGPMGKRLSRMQDMLGRVNDLVTLRARDMPLPDDAETTESHARHRAAKDWRRLRKMPAWWADLP